VKPFRHPGYLQWIRALPCSVCRTTRAVEGPYRAARSEPEVLRSVRHSSLRQAPPGRGRLVSQARASEVRRSASVKYPGDRRSPECEAPNSGGIGQLRGPVRRSGVCARIHGGRGGAGDSQDERTPAGDPGKSGLRFEALGQGEEVRHGATVMPPGICSRTVEE
jgi:hypothetical protein